MRTGTKSILFGAHQFVIHPVLLAIAWWRLYGFPADPRLWIAFFIHDLGYWGKENMDDAEGEKHVEFGAGVMRRLFGDEWGDFCLYHSRFYAKKNGKKYSRLCVADKLLIVLMPWWLFLPLANLSGEINEYMALSEERTAKGEPKYASMNVYSSEQRQWYANVQEYLRRWVSEHKTDGNDTWTPA